LYLEAEVLEIQNENAIISIGHQIVSIKNRNYQKGKIIRLEVDMKHLK